MATEIENETPVEYPDTMIVEYQTPPVKDQLVQAAIGIGAAVAPVLLYVAGAAIYGGVSALRTRRKERKLAKDLAADTIVVPETPTEEN